MDSVLGHFVFWHYEHTFRAKGSMMIIWVDFTWLFWDSVLRSLTIHCLFIFFCYDSLSKTTLQGTGAGVGDAGWIGGATWSAEEMLEWSSLPMPELFTMASCGEVKISAESSLMSPRRPNRSRDWTELNWTN